MTWDKLQDVFRVVLSDDEFVLRADATKENTARWDSFNAIQLCVAIEEAFNVEFTTTEMETMTTVAGILKALAAHGVVIEVPA